MTILQRSIQHPRKTKAAWELQNPVLMDGQEVFEVDGAKVRIKSGDGETPYNDLPYAGGIEGDLETKIADVTVGNLNAGDQYSVGTLVALSETIVKMASKTYYPTFTAPSFGLSHNAGSLRKIGDTINVLLTFTFNRGAITGKTVNNIWQAGTFQDYRAGNRTNYNFLGSYDTLSNTYTKEGHVVIQGVNTFQANVTYADGPQPVDSKNLPYSTPLPGGTSANQSTSFEGVYPLYATTVNIATATEQALVSMISGNNIQMTLVAESGGNKQFFEIPTAWYNSRPLTQVQYFNPISGQFDTTNKISDFTITDVTEGGVAYKRATYNGANRGAITIKLIF